MANSRILVVEDETIVAMDIAATLRHARGNQTEAAKLLGISRKALWEKRKRYGLE